MRSQACLLFSSISVIMLSSHFYSCLVCALQKPFPGRRSSQRVKARVHGDGSAAVWWEIVSSFLEEPGGHKLLVAQLLLFPYSDPDIFLYMNGFLHTLIPLRFTVHFRLGITHKHELLNYACYLHVSFLSVIINHLNAFFIIYSTTSRTVISRFPLQIFLLCFTHPLPV